MSWLFSQALVAEYSAASCSDGERFAPLKLKPIPQAYCSNGKMTDVSRLSRFGMIFAPLTENHGEGLLTWFLAGFHARTSVLPEKAQESPESVLGYGKRCGGWFAQLDRHSSTWKTPQCSLLGGLAQFSETWPKWGSMRNGECWEQKPLVLPVTEKGCGYSLLRPTAQCWRAWTFRNLTSLVRRNHADGNIQEQSARCFRKMITAESNENLMQWPLKWTDLKPLETGKILSWQQQHLSN